MLILLFIFWIVIVVDLVLIDSKLTKIVKMMEGRKNDRKR